MLTFSHAEPPPLPKASAPAVITPAERAYFRLVANSAARWKRTCAAESDESAAVRERSRILQILREERGMSVPQIAQGLGYSASQINRYLKIASGDAD